MPREQDAWESQLRKGVVELVVLGLLAGEAKYGSQLVDELAERPSLAISAGTVYPLLSRLRKAGLIESAWRESPVGPPRKYYHLTESGVATLRAMTDAWSTVSATVNSIVKGKS